MKLLFCLECQDVVRLFPEKRSCKCGRSWGYYTADHRKTVQTTNSLSLAIANPDFDAGMSKLRDAQNEWSPSLFLRAWFNPTSEEDTLYTAPDGEEPGSERTQGTNDE